MSAELTRHLPNVNPIKTTKFYSILHGLVLGFFKSKKILNSSNLIPIGRAPGITDTYTPIVRRVNLPWDVAAHPLS